MDKLSGLIIDVCDDQDGDILRSIFPQQQEVPELIKSAEYLNHERREALPDGCFALVLQNGGTTLRKFACVDAGNTALSVEYFLKTGHRLPEEAQKVAAANLLSSCECYDIEPPEILQKVAMGLKSLLHLGVMGPEAVKSTKAGVGRNMAVARAAGSNVTPQVTGRGAPKPPQV